MKLYWLKRILFSLFSLVVVLITVTFLIYNLMDRSAILTGDAVYNKRRYNEQTMRAYELYEEYGYLTYQDFNFYLQNKYEPIYGPDYAKCDEFVAAEDALFNNVGVNYKKNPDVAAFISQYEGYGHQIVFLPKVTNKSGGVLSMPKLLAVNELNVFQRIGSFFANFIRFETIWDVQDDRLTDRGIHIEWDPRSNMPALIGNGTTHKYLVYFDGNFPFVHQNIVHINLGKSSKGSSKGIDTVDYMMLRTGSPYSTEQEYPKDLGTGVTHPSTLDFHTATYSTADYDPSVFNDHYSSVREQQGGLTRIGNSFVIGIISTIAAYIIGLPIGLWMALKKDKLVDKIGNAYIIFIMAVPSLAYIFMFATIGTTLFNLPFKFVFAENSVLPYILPTVSLGLPAAGGLMKWMRRYMIDQQNSDYVKFARSQGLSEGEIFSKHISRNALIFLVHSIPGNILFSLTGAIITERVYGVPGIGNMLTESITAFNNGMIIGVTVFYTALSIISMILGDALLAKYDPRVSLSGQRGQFYVSRKY